MPYLLDDLIINRVDLVDEGANSAAFISLYKRKEQSEKMDITEIIEKMNPEHAAVVKAEMDRLNDEATQSKTDCETAKQEASQAKDDLKTANDDLDNTKSELDKLKQEKSAGFDETETLKSMPEAAKEYFVKMKAQKEAAEEALRKAKESEEDAKAIAKAADLKALPVEQSALVGVLKGCSPELLEVLTTVAAAMDGTVLGEVGKGKAGQVATDGNAAWAKIEAKASDIAKSKGLSKAKAITQAVEENPDLYKEYLQGGAN